MEIIKLLSSKLFILAEVFVVIVAIFWVVDNGDHESIITLTTSSVALLGSCIARHKTRKKRRRQTRYLIFRKFLDRYIPAVNIFFSDTGLIKKPAEHG